MRSYIMAAAMTQQMIDTANVRGISSADTESAGSRWNSQSQSLNFVGVVL